MEGVRLTRWLLSPVPTFLLWRRMKLWELRSYDQVIKLEQERLVYQARLRSRFGRAWRRKAPVESLMPLRLARYGVPLAETAPAGLAAAGIEPTLLPPAPQVEVGRAAEDRVAGTARAGVAAPAAEQRRQLESVPAPRQPEHPEYEQQGYAEQEPPPEESPWLHARHPQEVPYQGGYDPSYDPEEEYERWYEEQDPEQYQREQYQAEQYQQQRFEETEAPVEEPSPEETGSFPIPVAPGRTRELGEGGGSPEPDEEAYYQVFKQSISAGSGYPTPREFSDNIQMTYGVSVLDAEAKRMVLRFQNRHTAELEDDHIA
jgi:hypothetical protein